METFEEFKQSIINKERHFKVKNSWGVYDYYKYYRKNRPKDKRYVLTEGQFYKLFRGVNRILANEFATKHYLELPCKMGEIYLLQRKSRSYFKDGKVRTNRSVDWDSTLKMWYEDKDMMEKKQLIYKESQAVPRFRYSKKNAIYANKSFYEFTINRFLGDAALKNFNNQLLCFDDTMIKNLYDG